MKYYIDFDRYYENEEDHWKRSAWVNNVRNWLEERNCKEEEDWQWERGDLLAVGVHIKNKEIATLFKLTFEV